MKSLPFQYNLLAICVIGAMQPAIVHAATSDQADSVQLETIKVKVDGKKAQKQSTFKTTKNAEELSKQLVTDNRDLVRYETGVTVVESGRFGSSGYAIRGVDENRVAINIDGLRQAETLSSSGFKELFEGYGNFNNTRNSVEIENVKQATISKGADSVAAGSGALGGSVGFETKEANDFLTEKDWHVGYKTGFSSANNQKLGSLSLAARAGKFDAMLIATRRNNHELENYGYHSFYPDKEADLSAVGREREKADPYQIKSESNLIKIGFEPNENHRFAVAFDDTRSQSNGKDLSYVLRSGGQYSEVTTLGERLTHDESNRRNVRFSYRYDNPTPLWDSLEVSFSNQKIKNKARTDEFCDGPNCNAIRNEQGLKLKSEDGAYKVVDKYDGEISYSDYAFKNSKGETMEAVSDPNNYWGPPLKGQDYTKISSEALLINCDKIDCNSNFSVFVDSYRNNGGGWVYPNTFENRRIIKKTAADGRVYGEIERFYKGTNYSGEPALENTYVILPNSTDYARNDYKDRDLNTNTKQFKLDLKKNIDLAKTTHKIKYGLNFEKSDKRMVNEDGYTGGNVQWWADNFYCAKQGTPYLDNWGTGSCGGNLRKKTDAKDSYLIPVETKSSALHFADSWRLTDKVAVDMQYRYDSIKLKPSYDSNVPVPKGLIAGIFVPVPDRWFGTDAPCGYNTDCLNQNLAQNLEILLQDRKFKHHSYNLGLTFDPTSWLRVQGKYSNGFRAPTSDEVYMTFKHPSFSITPNVLLKPEIAKTKELALTLHRDNSFVTFDVFKTDYDDFIDLNYLGERPIDAGSVLNYPFYQNINREKAKVTGFEINSRLGLDLLSDKLAGFHVGYKYTRQKGRITSQEDGEIPMNAIQPATGVYNVGYSADDDKYGINLYATQVAAKKAEDTYNSNWKSWRDGGKTVQGKPVTDSTLAWRSPSYTVLDAIFHYKPTKNITLSGGVFNITNKKYMTWDSARSIRSTGTINLINQDTGAGINRFYAPERNYRIAAEFKF